jgi:GAF domain-containing protein/HAMP domain-containing protein
MNVQVQMNPQSNAARQIARAGIAGTALADALYLYAAVQQPAWQLIALFIATSILLVTAAISLRMVQRGDTKRGMVLLVGVTQVVFAVGTALITTIGWAFAIGIVFITAMIAVTTLPSRENLITAVTAAISGLISIALETLAPSYRLPAPLIVEIIIPALIVVIVFAFGYLLIRQFKRSLRAKLLVGFTIIFLTAGIFGSFAVREQYIETQSAAVTEASNVLESIALSVGRYPASAQDYVAQLNKSQSRYTTIIDLQRRILADPNNAKMFTIYQSDPNGEVTATLKDGKIRTFAVNAGGTAHGSDFIVGPVYDASGKISGAAIVDYTSLFQQLQESTRETTQTLITFGAASLIVLFAAIQFIAGQIADPIILLRDAAVEVGSGHLDAPIPDRPSEDEIGALTLSFKNMTLQLRNLIGTLEQRVKERTAELALASQQAEHRASQLEAISKVSESISAIRDLKELLPKITQTISEQFGFYHAGIFLLDEAGEYAILQAANSEGGQRMVQRGHRLKVGEQGIVGYVTGNGVPRIALDTGADAVFFDNPDLPTTRSEMALPLFVDQRVIGALDVQSEKPSAFTHEDIEVLSTLATQVSIAIQNARLFEETNRSLREARATYRQYLLSALSRVVEEKRIGYRLARAGLSRLEAPINNPEIETALSKGDKLVKDGDAQNERAVLTVPIKLRDEVIGVLDIRKDQGPGWNEDEIDIVEAVAARVAVAAENATLIEDSQRRASKEQLISEVTSKISASINMRNVLQTAAEELGRAIPGSDVIIQFQPGNSMEVGEK